MPDETQPPEGYRVADVMTIGYDGGNFDVKSVVFQHDKCGCLVLPSGVGAHERHGHPGAGEAR